MVRMFLIFFALCIVVFFVGHWLIDSNVKQKVSVLKTLAYSFVCAIITLVILVGLVILF